MNAPLPPNVLQRPGGWLTTALEADPAALQALWAWPAVQAAAAGLSEGAWVAGHAGPGEGVWPPQAQALRLRPDSQALQAALAELGPVTAVLPGAAGQMQCVLSGPRSQLQLHATGMAHLFLLLLRHPGGVARSLRAYDAHGQALLHLHLQGEQGLDALSQLASALGDAQLHAGWCPHPAQPAAPPPAAPPTPTDTALCLRVDATELPNWLDTLSLTALPLQIQLRTQVGQLHWQGQLPLRPVPAPHRPGWQGLAACGLLLEWPMALEHAWLQHQPSAHGLNSQVLLAAHTDGSQLLFQSGDSPQRQQRWRCTLQGLEPPASPC